MKAYVTFHRYSYICSSFSKLRLYLVVVLTYKGNHEVSKLVFKLKILNIIFWMGYPYVCYPTTTQTLTPNVMVKNHFLQKKYRKNILMLSKVMTNVNIIIKFPPCIPIGFNIILVWTPCLMHRCVCIQTTFPKPLYIRHFASIHRDPGHWKSWCLHYLWPVK